MLEKILMAADEVNTTTPPTIPTTGTAGYPQDTAPGVKGTPVQAWQFDMLHRSLTAIITGLGGTFGANVTALWAALGPHVRGVWCGTAATDNTASGDYSVVLGGALNVASGTAAAAVGGGPNTASGDASAVVAGTYGTASGVSAVVAGGDHNTASGDWAFVAGGAHNTASGIESAVVGGKNAENGTAYSLGLGKGSSAPTVNPAAPANQNLSVLLKGDGGDGLFAGTVTVGGDVDAGTGATVTLDGATGDISADGNIDSAGHISADGNVTSDANVIALGYVQAVGQVVGAGGLTVGTTSGTIGGSPYVINKPSGSGGKQFSGSTWWGLGEGGEELFVVNNSLVGANTHIYPSAWCDNPSATPQASIKARSVGQFTVAVQNNGQLSVEDALVMFSFFLVNPS